MDTKAPDSIEALKVGGRRSRLLWSRDPGQGPQALEGSICHHRILQGARLPNGFRHLMQKIGSKSQISPSLFARRHPPRYLADLVRFLASQM